MHEALLGSHSFSTARVLGSFLGEFIRETINCDSEQRSFSPSVVQARQLELVFKIKFSAVHRVILLSA